jgi:acyl-CoA thioesterase
MGSFDEFLSNDKFARHINVEMLEAANGHATARMQVEEYHLNSHGTVHGGAVFSLADAVFAAASNSHGVPAVAINVSISFLKAVTAGTLTARATEVSLNSTLATYEVRVTTETGELVATFQGMVYRKKNRS